MAKKGGQVVLQEEINTNEDWTKMLEKPGIYGKFKYHYLPLKHLFSELCIIILFLFSR